MDVQTLIAGVGYSGWLVAAVQLVRAVLTSTCLKAKCNTDADGNPHLDLSIKLNDSQKQLADQHPDVADSIKRIEALLQERAKAVIQSEARPERIAVGSV